MDLAFFENVYLSLIFSLRSFRKEPDSIHEKEYMPQFSFSMRMTRTLLPIHCFGTNTCAPFPLWLTVDSISLVVALRDIAVLAYNMYTLCIYLL